MKYYIIAGEASGDLHGSNLIKALKQKDNEVNCRVWGGDLMKAAGGELRKHYRDLAFMGFVEVVKNLRTILRNIKFCKEDILAFEPDALVLIDYPGFNLRIAKWAKTKGIKVIYYISPQIWAWNSKRVHKMKPIIDCMLAILPFEKAFYKKYDWDIDFVGHPLLDEIHNRKPNLNFKAKNNLDARPIIALLPGSRKQEIRKMLGILLEVVPHFEAYQFVIAGAPAMPTAFYESVLDEVYKNREKPVVKLIQNETYDLLQHATAALVTSGTATLETALFEVPQVVCYKGNALSYQIARRIINVEYIALANLVLDKPAIKELIQDDLTQTNLTAALNDILNGEKRQEIQEDYHLLKQKLGGQGASKRAATLILNS